MPRRLENVESEMYYLRKQLDEMRELLQRTCASPTRYSQQMSPLQTREPQPHIRQDSVCPSSCSQPAHSRDHSDAMIARSRPTYTNGTNNSYPRSVPDMSPNQIPLHPLYESPQADNRPLKRKRSCFEISDEAVADFIDKGLITLDCAISSFNT